MQAKYLTEEEIYQILTKATVSEDFMPLSQDTYNETAIATAVKDSGKEQELLEATITVAVVGIGNQRYGQFQKGKDIIDVGTLMEQSGVKLRLPPGSVLKESDLTIGRLCRLFRHKIRRYLIEKKYETYIFRKYSSRNLEMNHILFRGAEYLEDLTDVQQAELKATYENMDTILRTNLVEKMTRIQQARNPKLRFSPG